MDLHRYLDLYIAEAQEHVRLLQRSLLGLESGAGNAMEEAFRAAHTLKGISAAMGYSPIAALAHSLEDRLAEIRAGTLEVTATGMDALLAEADAIEAAVMSVTAPAAQETPAVPIRAGRGDDAGAPVAAATPSVPAATPPGTAWVAQVRLAADTPLPQVRALLVMRSLEDLPGVLGSEPSSFDADFDGSFRIFFNAEADPAKAESAISRAGDIATVEFVPTASAEAGAGGGEVVAAAVSGKAAGRTRIRVDAGDLDDVGDAVAELSVLFARLGPHDTSGTATGEMLDRMGVVLAGLQHDILQLRMAPVRQAFDRLPRVVRDAARTVGRDVDLVISGDDVELDRAILEEIADPLVHLLRNAVDHGIEDPAERIGAGKAPRGQIRLHAERERSSVCITVSDDGRGVQAERVVARARTAGVAVTEPAGEISDEELFRLLSHPGFSTAESVSAVSGRGVGLDVVVSRVRVLGGAISMQSTAGASTTFTIRLPMTLALAQALHVRVGDEEYAIPLTHVSEVIELSGDGAADSVELRGESLRLVRLRRMLQAPGDQAEPTAIVAGIADRRAALAVDELVGREQILVKGFDGVTGMLPYFSGATILGDGRPALVIDPLSVI